MYKSVGGGPDPGLFNPHAVLDRSRVHDRPAQPSRTRMKNARAQAQTSLMSSMANAGSEAASYSGYNPFAGNSNYVPSGTGRKPITMNSAPTPPLGTPQPQQRPSEHGRLGAFLQAIATQESNSNYGAVGVPTRYGTAYGKYQILDSNIEGPAGWDMEALGQNISVREFLSTPEYQEQIARAKLSSYFKQFGAEGAAKAWYAGPDDAYSDSDASQYGGPSINAYSASVQDHMQDFLK